MHLKASYTHAQQTRALPGGGVFVKANQLNRWTDFTLPKYKVSLLSGPRCKHNGSRDFSCLCWWRFCSACCMPSSHPSPEPADYYQWEHVDNNQLCATRARGQVQAIVWSSYVKTGLNSLCGQLSCVTDTELESGQTSPAKPTYLCRGSRLCYPIAQYHLSNCHMPKAVTQGRSS